MYMYCSYGGHNQSYFQVIGQIDIGTVGETYGLQGLFY